MNLTELMRRFLAAGTARLNCPGADMDVVDALDAELDALALEFLDIVPGTVDGAACKLFAAWLYQYGFADRGKPFALYHPAKADEIEADTPDERLTWSAILDLYRLISPDLANTIPLDGAPVEPGPALAFDAATGLFERAFVLPAEVPESIAVQAAERCGVPLDIVRRVCGTVAGLLNPVAAS